jgi:peptidyl-prolyl cis-trans isomerase SurA
MRKMLVVLAVMAFAAAVPQGAQADGRQETIAAVVNGDAVTASDLSARLHLVLASSGMQDNPDLRQRMAPQILSGLIEERLKLQEAARENITVAPADIQRGIHSIASQNQMTDEQFQQVLQHQAVSVDSLEDQIRSQIAWSMVIQKKLRPRIDVTDTEVDDTMKRLSADIGKTEYLVAEIFLPVTAGKDDGQTRQFAEKLLHQLRDEHAPFQAVARQFSQSPGASRGGDMGWVQQGQLPDEIDGALVKMSEGTLSEPVKSPTGYHILFLRKKREIAQSTLPSREEIYQKIGMERLDRMQKSYLMDLRSEAFIENRV